MTTGAGVQRGDHGVVSPWDQPSWRACRVRVSMLLTGARRVGRAAERHEDQRRVALIHLVVGLAVAQVARAAWPALARTGT